MHTSVWATTQLLQNCHVQEKFQQLRKIKHVQLNDTQKAQTLNFEEKKKNNNNNHYDLLIVYAYKCD